MTLFVFREYQEAPENNNLFCQRRDKLRLLMASKGYRASKRKNNVSQEKAGYSIDISVTLGHINALKCASTCLGFLLSSQIEAIGGTSTKAIAIASALSENSTYSAFPKPWFYINNKIKSGKISLFLEGFTPKKAKIVLVSDIIASTEPLIEAVNFCRKQGLEIVEFVTLVVQSEKIVAQLEKELGKEIIIKTLFLADEIQQEYLNLK